MGWLDTLLGRAPSPPVVQTFTTNSVATAVPYLDISSAMGLSAVQRCVNLIGSTIADMPWTEWKGDVQLDASRLVRAPMSPLVMSRREWTFRVVATEALYNAVHLLHVGGTDSEGLPFSLLPLPPSVVQPGVTDPWGLSPPAEYWIGGQRVPAEFVTVIRRSPLPGVADTTSGLLELARQEFTAAIAADTHLYRYWVAGGPTVTVITSPDDIPPAKAEELAQRWADRRSMGADYPAVLGRGAEAKPWGADPMTESAVEARREMVADIGRHFGVPTRILNAPAGDSETYSNVEQDAIDLYRYTLRGYIGPIEDVISTILPGDHLTGRRLELDPQRFLQGDLGQRTTAHVALVAAGIETVDEARVRGFGLPPGAVAPTPEALPTPTSATVTIS